MDPILDDVIDDTNPDPGFHFQIDPDPKGTTLWIQIRNRNKNIQLGKCTFFRASRYETIALQREITPNVYFFYIGFLLTSI